MIKRINENLTALGKIVVGVVVCLVLAGAAVVIYSLMGAPPS